MIDRDDFDRFVHAFIEAEMLGMMKGLFRGAEAFLDDVWEVTRPEVVVNAYELTDKLDASTGIFREIKRATFYSYINGKGEALAGIVELTLLNGEKVTATHMENEAADEIVRVTNELVETIDLVGVNGEKLLDLDSVLKLHADKQIDEEVDKFRSDINDALDSWGR